MTEDRDEERRAAERRRLVDEARRIDERYRGVPVRLYGPLETDDDIAAAAVEMQREIEIDAGHRRPPGKKDH